MGKIYLDGVGYRHPIHDKEQIIWYFEQIDKTWNKGRCTKFYINILKMHENNLLEIGAYEILGWLKDKVSDEKMKRSIKHQEETKLRSLMEQGNMMAECQDRKAIRDLIALVRYN